MHSNDNRSSENNERNNDLNDQLSELNQLLDNDVPETIEEAPITQEPQTQTMEIAPTAQMLPQVQPAQIEATQLLSDFQQTSHEILGNFREDRRQVDEVVRHLWDKVKNNEDIPRTYIEQLVSALGVKADINANACKLLEAKAKMMSAGKSAFINNNNIFAGSDLDELLDRPIQ